MSAENLGGIPARSRYLFYKGYNWKLLLACALVRVSCVCSLKTNSVDKKWSSSVAGRVLTLSFVIPFNTYNEWRRVFRSVAIFLFVFALFCFLIESS